MSTTPISWLSRYYLNMFAGVLVILFSACGTLPEHTVSGTQLVPEARDAGAMPFEAVAEKPRFEYDCDKDEAQCFMDVLDAIVRNNFVYPEDALRRRVDGTVIMTIGIRANGEVTVVGVDGPDPVLEQASLGYLNDIPNVYAGKDEFGNPVPVEFEYPVNFLIR
ncbi:energy transducer TonB [Robertkochia flava]|uniref:energy transducer TonB n=1 Tax=Robertkochia flava TaxID=3447986 RepID=UPI001CC9D0F8|nr:energy transducer TonB [Robertkochia marina]